MDGLNKDSIQERLTAFAGALSYERLPPEVIHAVKVRVIDTLGALIGGLHGEPCRIARNVALQCRNPAGATILGTQLKATPDLAAFANAVTARYAEMNDVYHWPGSAHGHPSDALTPVLAAAEHAGCDGREFIVGVVLAYEVYTRFSDNFRQWAFDPTNFCSLASAVGAGRMLGLDVGQLRHCISMAAVPGNILRQVRLGDGSMWKAVAAGKAGQAGVFAALMARAGMEGPHLPFEGKAGWCDHVATNRFTLDALGGDGATFKILDTHTKNRPCKGGAIACVLAAEQLAASVDTRRIRQIVVELNKTVKEVVGSGRHHWYPDSREAADHSAPFLVSTALMDGKLTLRSFNDAHLWNPELRALMQKVEVLENEEFTRASERVPVEHKTRVTVVMEDGQRHVAETGGDEDDLSAARTDAQIETKFRELTDEALGTKRIEQVLQHLWQLEQLDNVAQIAADLAIG